MSGIYIGFYIISVVLDIHFINIVKSVGVQENICNIDASGQ